jgi:hypothetical protein
MGLNKVIDLTTAFNANGSVNFDVGMWDSVVVQIVGAAGTVSFNGTNDGGAITGVTDGNALSAKNFTAVQGTNEATGTAATSGASGSYKFPVTQRFLQLTGGSPATEVLVMMYKLAI